MYSPQKQLRAIERALSESGRNGVMLTRQAPPSGECSFRMQALHMTSCLASYHSSVSQRADSAPLSAIRHSRSFDISTTALQHAKRFAFLFINPDISRSRSPEHLATPSCVPPCFMSVTIRLKLLRPPRNSSLTCIPNHLRILLRMWIQTLQARNRATPPWYSSVSHTGWSTDPKQVTKMYPYSLRPVLIITSIVGFIWAVALGVHSIRDRNDDAGELVVTSESLFSYSRQERLR